MADMSSDDIGRLIYLVMLGTAVGGYFIVSNRNNLGKRMRELAVWSLIFLGAIAGYGLWEDVRDDVSPRQSIAQESGEISVPQSPDGHYYLTLDINGTPTRFVVDTGATEMVLSVEDASRAGINVNGLAYLGRAETANGTVRTAAVRLDTVELGPFTDRNMPAAVNAGDMPGSLLGMRYLNRYDRLEIRDSTLVLER